MRGKFKERKPGETGGALKRIPKERDLLTLQKTEEQPKETDQKRIDRLLDNALNVGSRLQNQLGLPKNAFDVGRTFNTGRLLLLNAKLNKINEMMLTTNKLTTYLI